MRARTLVVAVLVATVAVPGSASAVVVVRTRGFRPIVPIATVAVVATVASRPPTQPPPPSAPRPPPVTSPLPIDSTMWVLPSGCLRLSLRGETLYQCGPSFLKQAQSEWGPFYFVVPPP